jgi:hypothetical protein
MTPLSTIPLNSWTWLLGSLACFMLCYRSYNSYKISKSELSKYIALFGLLMGFGQAWLAVPSFFSLDTNILGVTYRIGELFIYSSAVAQAAIAWCFFMRPYMKLRTVTIPIACIGFVSWLYALPYATLKISNNFINYRDPTFSTLVIAAVLIGLFVPVGIYFLKSAKKEPRLQAKLLASALGLVYIGVGFFTGGVEILSGQVITPRSAIGDLVFFSAMFLVLLWPRRNNRI